ncbi:subtilisin-like protease SBT3.9 isoform X3 [Gossypium raimondii]|uniref:subtilisin-like protease SBT3.9 isoform X3 n=1 Tax=Gossypium raimondii TaxID=29730 RepID=UPI00227A9EB2|nr:subtilisin-like protease SBT3.9 isoform X3 [Gossypium raimondii]
MEHPKRLLIVNGGSSAVEQVYIVYMGERHTDEPNLLEDSHHQILSDILGSKTAMISIEHSKESAKESILYSYKHGFSGFAAVLSQSQAKLIADVPGVVHVVPNRILNLHTTRSWDFLQVKPQIVDGILSEGHSGLGTIIGVMDTGIWPESESFRDDGMGKFPSRWKGICQEGNRFNRSHCNRKIIGARWYIKGYEAEFGKLSPSDGVEFLSPRDAVGHGTHTSSTASGAEVKNANFRGLAQGIARGGAPSSWLAIYKVCWATGGCSSADLLAAIDDAIFDGVDIISASLGSPPPLSTYVDDALAIGSFHAVARGISVVCSAGNTGPYPQTVINTAPWVMTVAASTIDRDFPAVITLGNNQTVVGQSFYTGRGLNKFHPIVYGADIAATNIDGTSAGSCDLETLNATLARGKVILCFQSRWQRSAAIASKSVLELKGAGVIFAQFPTKDVSCPWSFPCVQVDFEAGTSLLTYMAASRKPVVKFSFSKTVIGQQLAPEIAYFSSRGPSSLSPSVLKPDIAAPGVDILASWSPAASSKLLNSPQTKASPFNFKLDSGTSMACPHISGIVALLKGIHPKWSPAAIKSALVTTASMKDEYGQNTVAEGAPHKQADPFDYGGGNVDPNKALDPGLIYDIKPSDYVCFLYAMGYNSTAIRLMTRVHTPCHKSVKFLRNLNLPSITLPELKQRMTVSRTVTNVGPVNSIYVARIQAPAGIDVSVEPWILTFNSTTKKLKFKVTFCSQLKVQGRYSFGNLYWEDGIHVVRIPVVVRIVINNHLYSET